MTDISLVWQLLQAGAVGILLYLGILFLRGDVVTGAQHREVRADCDTRLAEAYRQADERRLELIAYYEARLAAKAAEVEKWHEVTTNNTLILMQVAQRLEESS